MKKLLFLLPLLGAIGYASAPHSKLTSVQVASLATEPTSATAGLPVMDGTDELRRIIVTARRPDDGGADDMDMSVIQLAAWKYATQSLLSDAGTLLRWSRMPELDMKYATDSGSPYVLHNDGISMSVAVPPMGNGSRITYTGHVAACVDGGTCNAELLIEGAYRQELDPR